MEDLPGQNLFQYVDEDGELKAVTSADVNEYLRESMPGGDLSFPSIPQTLTYGQEDGILGPPVRFRRAPPIRAFAGDSPRKAAHPRRLCGSGRRQDG